MKISKTLEEANDIANKYNLNLIEIDRTDNNYWLLSFLSMNFG